MSDEQETGDELEVAEGESMGSWRTAGRAPAEGEVSAEGGGAPEDGDEGDWSLGSQATIKGWRTAEEWQGRRWRKGEEILGRYVVEGELGQGGMGVVYACRDKVGGVRVAVKALPPELSHNSVEMEEVRDNFELVYGLSHPNIAGVRTLEKDERGEYYLVMETADGEPLRRWMRKKTAGRKGGGGIPLAVALPVLRQVAAALDYSHSMKVIHRDVKPGNIVIDGQGRAKVLDFGLAAQIRTSLSRASQAYRGTSGTGPYMAPEQWEAQPQDAKTDQYALAVMAYEMLAGRLPFENSELAVLKAAVLHGEARDIPGLGKREMAALKRALSKKPEARWRSCTEFVDALSGRRPGQARTLAWAAGLVLAALAAGGAAVLWGGAWKKTKAAMPEPTQDMQADLKAEKEREAREKKERDAQAKREEMRKEAEKARTVAEHTKQLAEGAKRQKAYKTAEEAWKKGTEEFEKEDYKSAREAWEQAGDKYAEAKNEEDLLEVARNAFGEAIEARNVARQEPEATNQVAYREAEKALKKGKTATTNDMDFKSARKLFEEAEEKYEEARELAVKARAEAELEKRKVEKLEEALSAARAAAEDEWWEEVVRQVALAHQLQPDNLEADWLLKKAKAKLAENPEGRDEPKAEGRERVEGTVDTVPLKGGGELKLVWCPSGELPDGTPVSGFWMGQTEVTQDQWASVMGTVNLQDKSRGVDVAQEGEGYPMRAVSWAECQDFCEKLNEQKERGGLWRLPTETEWKWACEARGGEMGTAWLKETSGGQPHAVVDGTANAWGLYNMRGNVAEWCETRWGDEGVAQEFRVIQGGDYDSIGASRRRGAEGTQYARVGFRVCREE